MKYLLPLVVVLGCTNLHTREVPYRATDREIQLRKTFRYTPCTPQKTQLAYRMLYRGEGCAECVLYYDRCRDRSGHERPLQPRRGL